MAARRNVADAVVPLTRLRSRYLSTTAVARELGVPLRTVESWCETGRVRTKPGRKPGAPHRIVRSELERLKSERGL